MATPLHRVALFTTILVLTTAYFVYRHGVNLPVQDEWDLTCEFLSAGSLWEWIPMRHNEHRFWLGRTFWGAGMVLSGFDFRVGGWITLTMLLAAATGLVLTAARVRGRTSIADLFVPAVLLNAGHCFNFIMGYQVVFATTAVCGCGLIATALKAGTAPTLRTGMAANLWLVLMSGNGGFGVGFAPAISAWVAYIAWRRLRERTPGRWRDAAVLMLGPALVLGYSAWAMQTQPASSPPHHATLESLLAVSFGYLTIGLGSIINNPFLAVSGWVPAIAAAVVAIYLVALVRLGRAILWEPDERIRAVGLLCVLGGQAAVALGIGLTREGGMADRYATTSAIGLLACWAAGIRYGPRTPRGRFIDVAVCVLSGLTLAIANARPSPTYSIAGLMGNPLVRMKKDLQSGMPPTFLAGKYGQAFSVLIGDRIGNYIPQFHYSGLKAFRDLAPDPEMNAVPVPDSHSRIPRRDSVQDLRRPSPEALAIPAPQGHVHGLRFQFVQDVVEGYQIIVLHWKDADGEPHFAEAYGTFFLGRGTIALWINGPATDVRLERRGQGEGPKLGAMEWLIRP